MLSGLSLSFNSPIALIVTPVTNFSGYFVGELYQLQAISPVTSRVHQTCSAVAGAMHYAHTILTALGSVS